jgi:Protein of unknown function (Hypoth_ymh).
MTINSVTPEPADSHHYSWVAFLRDTLDFFVCALKYYEELLTSEAAEIEGDPHLKAFFTDEVRREIRFDRGQREAARTRQWLEESLAKSTSKFDCDLGLDHGTVRYLKSIGLLYLGFLKQRRNALSSKPNVTTHLLSALDRQITLREEQLATQGIFAKASALPLLVEQGRQATVGQEGNDSVDPSVVNARRPKPVMIDSIEILDTELKGRCLDLFNQFEESGQSERHDTVVTEATRILENRLRILTRSSDAATGADLAARAFAGSMPKIRVSNIQGEQDAVHLLYRGVFGFIRNQVHHKMLSDLAPERVVQILGLIDYLLYLANIGVPSESSEAR